MHRKLNNYLRTYRKRTGFTQDEIAFLLGCHSGAKISRYEHFTRLPNLKTIFAYEVIFRISARELFAGIHEQETRITLRRVRTLVKRLSKGRSDRKTMRKIDILRAVLGEQDEEPKIS